MVGSSPPLVPDGQVVIMTVDPGVTTGWCWLAVDRRDLCTLGTRGFLKVSDIKWGQIASGGTAWGENQVTDMLVQKARDCWEWAEVEPEEDTFFIVLEDFIPRFLEKDRAFLSPVRLNAKIEYAMRDMRIPLVYQMSSAALHTITDERLKAWNVYQPSSGVHARDASRHAILAARRYASILEFRRWVGIGLRPVA